jgi:hypothetical protein
MAGQLKITVAGGITGGVTMSSLDLRQEDKSNTPIKATDINLSILFVLIISK